MGALSRATSAKPQRMRIRRMFGDMKHIMPRSGSRVSSLAILVAGVSLFAQTAHAHDHNMKFAAGEYMTQDPIDSVLWTHILLQTLAWGIIFPTGMVLGIVKSRWHVPVQILGTSIAIVGYFLGHAHGGRKFDVSAHGRFAIILNLLLTVQVGLGIYLKLHLERGINARIRPLAVRIHGIVGKIMPVASWVQMLFGGITALGFCREDHLGQCLAHFIMGSAFIAYSILLMILLLVGQAWLARVGKSQEFFDSAVIAAWGCVNTFTEHRWGHEWAHNDIQHTSMGVIWWCAGLLGMWLSRGPGGTPKRNLIPALTIFMTGYAMSSHPQSLMISAKTHTVFGYTLMAAALARIIEISFVVKDKPHSLGEEPNSFQYLTPFLLVAGGYIFMGATEEQMLLLDGAHIDHVSYLLLLYSVAFLTFLFINVLIYIYQVNATPATIKLDPENPSRRVNGINGHINGRLNGHIVQDAQEFELEGLTSDDEEEVNEAGQLLKEQRPIDHTAL